MSNSKLSKSKSDVKNGFEVTLNFSSNVVGDFNAETNFRHKFVLTYTKILSLLKASANILLANTKLSKTQLFSIVELARTLGFLDSWAKEIENKVLLGPIKKLQKFFN